MNGGLPTTLSNAGRSLFCHQLKKSPVVTTFAACLPRRLTNLFSARRASAGIISTPLRFRAIVGVCAPSCNKRLAAASRNTPSPQLGSRTLSFDECRAHTHNQDATSEEV